MTNLATPFVNDEDDRIDITAETRALCRKLGLDETYVARLDHRVDTVIIKLYRGRDGTCQGPKYVDETTGRAAIETLTFRVYS